MEGEQFALHGISYDNVFVDGRNSTRQPIYRKFIRHLVDLVGETPMNPIMVVVRPLSRCSLPTQLKETLSINPYFIILACNAKSASSSTTIKHEFVSEECSHDPDFMV
jgi:hypothetical protein